jgi:hypothetical protein
MHNPVINVVKMAIAFLLKGLIPRYKLTVF